ncbi:hypothetical protein GCM10009527_096410 [Actinomadura nitritigenes]
MNGASHDVIHDLLWSTVLARARHAQKLFRHPVQTVGPWRSGDGVSYAVERTGSSMGGATAVSRM